ncbi:ImmA/IrrE family metallo-endopeptidase [Pseudomonas segetis]
MSSSELDKLGDCYLSLNAPCSAESIVTSYDLYIKSGFDEPTLFKDILNGSLNKSMFRRSGAPKEAETNLWLSKVKSLSEILVAVNKVSRFEGLKLESLKDISALSVDMSNISSVSDVLLDYGIILIYLPQSAGMKTDGVVFRLESGHPVVGMTLRFNRYDYYWFTLMHELSHICLHIDDFESPHFDCFDDEKEDVEHEADQAAHESFISRSDWRTLSVRKYPSEQNLLECASKYSISPLVLAGLVRYDIGNYKIFNDFVHSVDVKGAILSDA